MSLLDFLAVLCHRIVRQVRVAIVDFTEIEVSGRESDIGLCIDPDRQRVPVCDEDPLSDVKLSALHDHCVLDILLPDVKLAVYLIGNAPTTVLVLYHVQDFTEVAFEADATTA